MLIYLWFFLSFFLFNLICFSNGYNEQQYCKLQHSCEDTNGYNCDLPPHFKHLHKECHINYDGDNFFDSETSNMFVCLNRMDKKDKIFSKKVYPQKSKAKKLSLLLNYTEDYFVCRDDLHDWSLETFKNLSVNYTIIRKNVLYRVANMFRCDTEDFLLCYGRNGTYWPPCKWLFFNLRNFILFSHMTLELMNTLFAIYQMEVIFLRILWWGKW